MVLVLFRVQYRKVESIPTYTKIVEQACLYINIFFFEVSVSLIIETTKVYKTELSFVCLSVYPFVHISKNYWKESHLI